MLSKNCEYPPFQIKRPCQITPLELPLTPVHPFAHPPNSMIMKTFPLPGPFPQTIPFRCPSNTDPTPPLTTTHLVRVVVIRKQGLEFPDLSSLILRLLLIFQDLSFIIVIIATFIVTFLIIGKARNFSPNQVVCFNPPLTDR